MTFPNVAEAFADWTSAITLRVAEAQLNDFEVVDRKINDVAVRGVLQPLPAQKLLVKPEGERSWKWYTFWTGQLLPLDAILYDDAGLTYRVMGKNDWGGDNYREYELTQGAAR